MCQWVKKNVLKNPVTLLRFQTRGEGMITTHRSKGNYLKYSVSICSHLQINAFDSIFILFVWASCEEISSYSQTYPGSKVLGVFFWQEYWQNSSLSSDNQLELNLQQKSIQSKKFIQSRTETAGVAPLFRQNSTTSQYQNCKTNSSQAKDNS